MDSDAYAAVKGNEHVKLKKRLREAESAFPVSMEHLLVAQVGTFIPGKDVKSV